MMFGFIYKIKYRIKNRVAFFLDFIFQMNYQKLMVFSYVVDLSQRDGYWLTEQSEISFSALFYTCHYCMEFSLKRPI